MASAYRAGPHAPQHVWRLAASMPSSWTPCCAHTFTIDAWSAVSQCLETEPTWSELLAGVAVDTPHVLPIASPFELVHKLVHVSKVAPEWDVIVGVERLARVPGKKRFNVHELLTVYLFMGCCT